MTYAQVYNFYKDKRDADCKYTNELIKSGFLQNKYRGYMKVAKASDFSLPPSQWWHLMQYCLGKYEHHEELKNWQYTPCGELVFWMAEVSGDFDEDELETLKNTIINSQKTRREKNSIIHHACWNKIEKVVEQHSSTQYTILEK